MIMDLMFVIGIIIIFLLLMFGSGFGFESLLRIAELYYVAYSELLAYGLRRFPYIGNSQRPLR